VDASGQILQLDISSAAPFVPPPARADAQNAAGEFTSLLDPFHHQRMPGSPKTEELRPASPAFESLFRQIPRPSDEAATENLHPTLPAVLDSEFVSAAMLVQKAKQFDDGLYAAIVMAGFGKDRFIARLAEELNGEPTANAETILPLLFAARQLGGGDRPPSAWADRVDSIIQEFLNDHGQSKPLGFYTWSEELGNVFRRDRLLQRSIGSAADTEAALSGLRKRPDLLADYRRLVELQNRLSNPSSQPDLSALLERGPKDPGPALFPASDSAESCLLRNLFPSNRLPPPGFNLMAELVERVRTGQVQLKPGADDGWYAHQTWSLEPLVLPERTVEARHLRFSSAYRKHLLEMFKGVLALMRETHLGNVESTVLFGVGAPVVYIIRPQLTVEPLATCYRRRAESYGFLKHHLSRIVGRDALCQLRRLTPFGPVQRPLLDELEHIEQIFWGAYVTSLRELGLSAAIDVPDGRGLTADAWHLAFRTWQQELAGDTDLAADSRMMVPIWYDRLSHRWRVWLFLGWSARELTVSFFETPNVQVLDAAGNRVKVSFENSVYRAATPVFAEHDTRRLMNREEFRDHCDRYGEREEILAHLDGF